MKKVTISLEDDLLEASRRYAESKGVSFNRLLRDMLVRETSFDGRPSLDRLFDWVDANNLRSGDGKR